MKTGIQSGHIPKNRRRDGGILVAVMILVLLLGILGGAIVRNSEHVGVDASRFINDARRFWIAEAGLNHARALLYSSADFWTSDTFATNGYAVNIYKSNDYIFVTSTGTVIDTNRVVQQAFRITTGVPIAADYGIFSGGEMTIAKNALISGALSSTGSIYSAGGYDFANPPPNFQDGGTNYSPANYPPGGAPEIPVLMTNDFNELIYEAQISGTTNFTYSILNQTNYYDINNLTITGFVSGVGVIVVSGNVNFTGAGRINSNVRLISGGAIGINTTGACLGSNDLLYAADSFSLNPPGGNDKVVLTNGACALLTPGSITAEKNLIFYGVIFAGQEIDFKKEATIRGSLISAGIVELSKAPIIVYDRGQFSDFASYAFQAAITPIWWREL
jgi:hypothetical protein